MRALFGGCEALFQIGDDVVDMLGADGKTDGIGVNILILQLFSAQLRVGGCGRVDDQALHICDVCQQREDLQRVDEGVGFLLPTLDVKGKDAGSAVGEVSLKQGVIRVLRQGRVVDLLSDG